LSSVALGFGMPAAPGPAAVCAAAVTLSVLTGSWDPVFVG